MVDFFGNLIPEKILFSEYLWTGMFSNLQHLSKGRHCQLMFIHKIRTSVLPCYMIVRLDPLHFEKCGVYIRHYRPNKKKATDPWPILHVHWGWCDCVVEAGERFSELTRHSSFPSTQTWDSKQKFGYQKVFSISEDLMLAQQSLTKVKWNKRSV